MNIPPFPRRLFAALVAVAALAIPSAPHSQELRIAAVVNDEVISVYDLVNRLRFVIATSNLRDTPETRARLQPQVMRSLIDERLQTQEANRLNATIAEREMSDAIGRIETANNMPRGQLDQIFRQAGVDPATLRAQIRAGLAWNKVIQRRLRPQLQVGEDEIDEVIDRINASKGSTEYLLAEFFMAVETPDQEEEVKERMTEMVGEIARGQSFAGIAEQFSQSASATEGGDIGWVERGQLDEETVKALDDLPNNRMTPLIRTASGFYVYLLRDRRTLAAASPDDATVTLAQLLLPTEAGASRDDIEAQTELAQTVRDTVSGCDDFQRIASELNVGPVDPTPGLRIGDLASAIRPAVLNLKVGDVSAPQRTDAGVLLLMVCDRKDAVSNLPSRDDIADNLTRQRLDLVARRYLRDLRQQAFIDVRI